MRPEPGFVSVRPGGRVRCPAAYSPKMAVGGGGCPRANCLYHPYLYGQKAELHLSADPLEPCTRSKKSCSRYADNIVAFNTARYTPQPLVVQVRACVGYKDSLGSEGGPRLLTGNEKRVWRPASPAPTHHHAIVDK